MLPGSLETYAQSYPARWKDPRVFSSRSADRHCRRDRPAVGQGHFGRRSGWPIGWGRRLAAQRRPSRPAAGDQQRSPSPRSAAAFVCPRDGPGRDAALRRRAIGLWPDRGRAASTTISRWSTSLSEDDFPKIEAEMARIVKEDEPFERVEMDRQEAIQFCRDLQPIAQGRAPRGRAGRRADRLVLSAGRVHRSLPRPARARRGRDRGVQAALGGRGVLERRRLAPAVAAALRHGLLHQAGTRRAPPPGRRGQAPRPPRAGQAARTVPDRAGRGLGPGLLAAQGGRRFATNWRTFSTAS